MKSKLIYLRFKTLWVKYGQYINDRTKSEKVNRSGSEIWKDKFFTQILKFVLPTGIVALIASTAFEFSNYQYITAICDTIAFFSIPAVTLNRNVKIKTKKYFGMAVLVTFSIMKMVTLHSLMIGAIYLLVLSVITTLLFSKRAAYLSVALNALICIGFTILQMDGFPMHKINVSNQNISYRWMLFTVNIIFVNLIIVAVIVHITEGFESIIEKSKKLAVDLQLEVDEKVAKEKLLTESTTHYRSLFFYNPFPIIIYDPASLQIANVNQAAISRYGYAKHEFLEAKMNTLANCSENEFKMRLEEDHLHRLETHIAKDGDKIMAEIHTGKIKLSGRWLRAAIVRDLTLETAYVAAIAKKNKKMRDIAYMQSHLIRNPLAQILGITELLNDKELEEADFNRLLRHLINSAKQLDVVVTDIIKKTE